MRYPPLASVTTERVFSMRTGLAASTVTPGSTAPVASLTTPVNVLCACAAAGTSSSPSTTIAPLIVGTCSRAIPRSFPFEVADSHLDREPDDDEERKRRQHEGEKYRPMAVRNHYRIRGGSGSDRRIRTVESRSWQGWDGFGDHRPPRGPSAA